MERTLTNLTLKKVGESVKVVGWVNTRRDHGPIVFIDLRDRSGLLQVIFGDDFKDHTLAEKLRPEWVIEIEGKILERPENMVNSELETGTIELKAEKLTVFNQSETPPFDISGDGYDINEELRLKHRYLDLRRPRFQNNLKFRHRLINYIRSYLTERDFTEIETPLLTKSTPEGARDYVVPSRLHRGKFYALPQSPQQYKQLLMIAGFEKYFQIARAIRDEDTRKDRQPEHTQLDIEASFTSPDEIMNLIESLFTEVTEKLTDKKILKKPFPRIPYDEAMKKYKTDKPDIRDKKDDNVLGFAWIIDYPLFEWNKDEKRLDPVHHMFVLPREEDIDKLDNEPLEVRSTQYDFVCNGYELASGSMRIHKADLQEKIMKMIGLTQEQIDNQFGHLLRALTYGAPPHGGIAPGLDRILMLLSSEPNIREVIAFPKTGDGRDLMMDSPSEISKEQLKELGIEIRKDKSNR